MTTFDEIRQRARQALATDDSGRIDQEQARIERARREARRQARRERTQQRVQEARQRERERVLSGKADQGLIDSVTSTLATATDAVADGDGDRADDLRRAMSTDFDGDGDPLAGELGLQSGRRGDALAEQVNDNTGRIDDLETGVEGRASDDDLDITPGEFDDDILGGLR